MRKDLHPPGGFGKPFFKGFPWVTPWTNDYHWKRACIHEQTFYSKVPTITFAPNRHPSLQAQRWDKLPAFSWPNLPSKQVERATTAPGFERYAERCLDHKPPRAPSLSTLQLPTLSTLQDLQKAEKSREKATLSDLTLQVRSTTGACIPRRWR